MIIKLIGISEATIEKIGTVKRDAPITVSDEVGASLCAQIGMWEEVKDKKNKKEEL